MAEPGRVSRQPGWREVLLVAGAAVAIVLGAAVLTSILPTGLQEVVFHSPLAIVVLIVGHSLAHVAHLAPSARATAAMIEPPAATPAHGPTPSSAAGPISTRSPERPGTS